MILQAQQLSVSFGNFKAVDNVDLSLQHGARHALIGPNGAGKTTLINMLSGAIMPQTGKINLQQQDITNLTMTSRAQLGLVRTYQINTLFPDLTVLQSILIPVLQQQKKSLCWWQSLRRQNTSNEKAYHWLSYLGLEGIAKQKVRYLPYGQQRLLEIALALACEPKVLLLDEPAAGLPAADGRQILETINKLPLNIAILLIEHDMDIVFNFANQLTVLAQGAVIAQGPPEQIKSNPDVQEVYLGN